MQATYRPWWQSMIGKSKSIFVVVLVGLLASCIQRPPQPPVALDCQQLSDAGYAKRKEHFPYNDPDVYVADEVLLVGSAENVKAIADQFGLQPVDGDKYDQPTIIEPDRVLVRYAITNETLVEYNVCEINKLAAESGVFADPNYLFSPGQWSGMGGPWSEGENMPWVGNPGGGLGDAPHKNFDTQWALGPNGIGLIDAKGKRISQNNGAGVRIGIFDTSPFTSTQKIRSLKLPLSLHEASALAEDFGCAHEPCPDVRNHGLFVASLINVVAPKSSLELYRVLNHYGFGNMYDIALAINTFIDSAEQGAPTIINLSLGAHYPATPVDFGLPGNIHTLEELMQKATEKGILVIAAAGNDSYDLGQPTHHMQLPADYDNVIGVAASTSTQTRGCFSNMGDVAAAGGNGEEGKDNACNIPSDCAKTPQLCLIGRSLNSQTGYVYWVGTSFATPLVSGMAALQLSQGVSPTQTSERLSKKESEGGCAKTRSVPDTALGAGIARLGGVCQ